MFYDIIKNEFNLNKDKFIDNIVSNGDNQLFRQIRLITKDKRYFNKYVVFVDINNCLSHEEDLNRLLREGFLLNGYKFLLSERSASMTRQGVISFVREDIYEELDKRITMDIQFEETVLSKYMAYRGLMFSACHCIENWYPKIIVVNDYFNIIKDQHIRYACDEETDFVDKGGNKRKWKQKVIKSKTQDIKINVFDGSGICHPVITDYIQNYLQSDTRPTSFIIRAPFIKGLITEFDYTSFLQENNISVIKDLWEIEHSINEPMIILTESQYKGFKYFKKYNDYRDWQIYWNKFRTYNHCLGVTKWNFSKLEEPVYTRGNYQILQDLNLPFDEFCKLSIKSAEWVSKILDDDINYLYLFLGLTKDIHNPMNEYVETILKNPEMRKEKCVRDYIIYLIEKYIDELKCGKLWLKFTFKFLLPDLIALCQHIGGLPVKGILNHDEFYSNNIDGSYKGEYVIDRSPHICKSEHVILNGVTNNILDKYCGHLSNICMINIHSITPQRLNGAD